MPQAPTKRPAAPGSTAPQGPANPAPKMYPNLTVAKTAVSAARPGAQPIGEPQTARNGRVVTKGAVAVKKGKAAPGNQGSKNSHTTPGAIKPNGSPQEMAKVGSTTMTKTLARRVYANLP